MGMYEEPTPGETTRLLLGMLFVLFLLTSSIACMCGYPIGIGIVVIYISYIGTVRLSHNLNLSGKWELYLENKKKKIEQTPNDGIKTSIFRSAMRHTIRALTLTRKKIGGQEHE